MSCTHVYFNWVREGYLRILLKLSEALNIYKVQLRFICVRQKINKISHRISTPMWLVSFMLHSYVIVMGKSISGSYKSFGLMKWFVLFHILFGFSYKLCYTFSHV